MRRSLLLSFFVLFSGAALAQVPASTGVPEVDACAAAVAANGDAARQVKLCKEAVEAAVGKGNQARVLSYEYDAEAMLRNNQRDHAMAQVNHAIEHIDRGGVDDSVTGRAYLIRAHVHESLKGLMEASEDAAKAEEFQRKAMDAAPEQRAVLAAQLKSTLLYEAQLLKALRRDGDAIAKREEAAKL